MDQDYPIRKKHWLGLGILLVTTAGVLSAASEHTIEAKRLPDHTLLIPVRINDTEAFWCSFDTGGSRTLALDAAVAAKAGLRANGSGRSAGEGPNVVTDQRLSGATLSVGDLRIPDRTVVIRDLGSGATSDCIFGGAILESFVVEVDYQAPAFRVFDPSAFQPAPQAIGVPVTFEYGNPMVSARIVLQPGQTVDAKLLVDTAVGQWPLAINKRFADGQDLLTRVRKTVEPPFQAAATGGSIGLLAARADSLTIAGFMVPGPVMMLFRAESGTVLPWDGNLGSEFLRRFVLTIDYPGQHLFLERNAEFDGPPSPYDGSGAWIRGVPGNFTVARVLPDSPAAKAELEAGDVVLAMDGTPASDLTILQIHSKLYRSSGNCTLLVRRRGTQFSATLDLRAYL